MPKMRVEITEADGGRWKADFLFLNSFEWEQHIMTDEETSVKLMFKRGIIGIYYLFSDPEFIIVPIWTHGRTRVFGPILYQGDGEEIRECLLTAKKPPLVERVKIKFL